MRKHDADLFGVFFSFVYDTLHRYFSYNCSIDKKHVIVSFLSYWCLFSDRNLAKNPGPHSTYDVL